MSEQSQNQPPHEKTNELSLPAPRLPRWLTRRMLTEDEHLVSVYGPKYNPGWERYVTHPLLFLVTAIISATWVVVALVRAGGPENLPAVAGIGALALVVAAIVILGVSCGYF